MTTRKMDIRTATRADLDAVLAIEQSCYRFPWSRQQFIDEFDNPVATIAVAQVEGKIAGYLCSWLICGELQIQNLAIAPDYRRCGIAHTLLEDVINRGRKENLTSVWLEVREGNQAALGLYLGCGFEVRGRRKKYYQDGEDALLLGINFSKETGINGDRE